MTNASMSTSLLRRLFCATYFSACCSTAPPMFGKTSLHRHIECALRKSPCYLFIGPARNCDAANADVVWTFLRQKQAALPPSTLPLSLCGKRQVSNPCQNCENNTESPASSPRHCLRLCLRLVLPYKSCYFLLSSPAFKGHLRATRFYTAVPISTA